MIDNGSLTVEHVRAVAAISSGPSAPAMSLEVEPHPSSYAIALEEWQASVDLVMGGSTVAYRVGGPGPVMHPAQLLILALALGIEYYLSSDEAKKADASLNNMAGSFAPTPNPECPEGECSNTNPSNWEVSDRQMYQLGNHFHRHGRDMGYRSKAEYDEAAKAFARQNQNNPSASLFEGIWRGKGQLSGSTQRIISVDGKTVIIDARSGQIIDFYRGSESRGIIHLRKIQ